MSQTLELTDIWPTLGHGYKGQPRNTSYTKKGPGRRHDYVTIAEKLKKAKQSE